ncbi:MAG: hypothetical protein ACTSRT_03310 [Promethearchaeota archaeon]
MRTSISSASLDRLKKEVDRIVNVKNYISFVVCNVNEYEEIKRKYEKSENDIVCLIKAF